MNVVRSVKRNILKGVLIANKLNRKNKFTHKQRSDFMNEKTLFGIDCNGTEIYGQLDKISVHTNNHPNCDGTSWGWLDGCSKFVCWSNKSSSRFTKKDADELANKWNNRRKK